jgi:hypothetical protein
MSQNLKGFNPLGIVVDTDNDTFTVYEETFGSYLLKVADTNKPLWYGNYQEGRLAIYKASMEPIEPTSVPCYAIIYVIAGQPDSKMDSVGAVLVDIRVSYATSVGMLLENIKHKLIGMAMEDKNEQVAHGYAHIH